MNLTVVKADAERDLLLIKGSVPGPSRRHSCHPECSQGCPEREWVLMVKVDRSNPLWRHQQAVSSSMPPCSALSPTCR